MATGNDAHITVLSGKMAGKEIPFTFNPTEYSVSTSLTYGKQSLPGLTTPVTQFVSGDAETLTMELLFDTYEDRADVRKEYTDTIDLLLQVDGSLHAPPLCQVVWGTALAFTAVLESAEKTFTMFTPEGVPVRARVNVTFSKYDRPGNQAPASPPESADKTKVWSVTEGDTLWGIAAEEYGDPRQWRVIAEANEIENPRTLRAGRDVVLPPLET